MEIEDPTKNSYGAKEFIKAIESGDLSTAFKISKSIGNEERKYAEYLIGLGSEKLVGLISSAREHKGWLLGYVYWYAKQEFINEILRRVKPSDDDLISVVFHWYLASRPDRFIDLLKRFFSRDDQKKAVQIREALLEYVAKVPATPFNIILGYDI